MAVASWMLRNRVLRSGRFNRNAQESEENIIKLDLVKDPHTNARDILSELSKEDLTDGKRLNYLNNYVKLVMHLESNLIPLGYTTEEILCCLRYSLINELTQIRSATFRAIRYTLTCEKDVVYFNKLLIPYMVVRSLDLCFKNDVERIEAMKLIRKALLVSPENFDMTLARCLVSFANGGIEEKDRMLRVCLALLAELGILNPDLFIASGGVAAVTRNLMECQTPKIAESLCGVLLLLLDRPVTRNHASVDLHCVAAPYCDFHYRHGWAEKTNNANRDERDLRFYCSRLALLSVLRSWPGIQHFCSPNDINGLKAMVEVLYLNQLEVRKAVLDFMYDLLNLPQPEWTDELSVALSAIDPAEPQASWRLGEGFVAAEGRSVLPHLARTTPSITDMHLSLLLYCFLESGLLGALAEVIATSDTFISVRATVLLGELLRLMQVLLPPECCNISPALPNLIEYAATNHPNALHAVTALQQLHKLLKRRPASYSLYLDFIMQSGSNFSKSAHKCERVKRGKSGGQGKSRLTQLVLKDNSEDIKETGVLYNKDAFTWNWSLIGIILKGKTELNFDLSENTHRSFFKRLIEYYLPSSNRYSHMDMTSPKNTQQYTLVGLELIKVLVSMEDAYSTKLLVELFTDISSHIARITSGKSAHDCLFSPQHMANTQCQSYFLFIGRLGSTTVGAEMLNNLKIYKQLQDLATTTNHDCYVKLIVSSLDYRESAISREILSAVLTCPNETSRLYATQFLLVLLRAGLPHYARWGMKMLATQLADKSRTIYLSALSTIHEACEIPMYLEQLVKINPDLLHLGEKGLLLLIRFMSTPAGFNYFNKKDFIINEVHRWDEYFNYRYVVLVEGETADALTLHQRGEDGHYDKRTSLMRSGCRKDLFLPPHIYGQLAQHSDGFQLLLENGVIETSTQCIENGLCETEDDILKLKAALWVLGHFGSTKFGAEYCSTKDVLSGIVWLAENCVVYSIRATAFYALGLIGSTKTGADHLFKLGWVCTRHDRHDRWPIIEEENWAEQKEGTPIVPVIPASSNDSDRSDQAFASEFCMLDADSSTTTEEDMLLLEPGYATIGQGKSLTLPNQNMPTGQHKRSLSESKTFEMLRGSADRRDRLEGRLSAEMPHRYRDNSVTESTTSGVSSCESVLGKSVLNDRGVQTLTPIPSISSLQTVKTGMKLRRHSESSRRVSSQSIPTERGTGSPASGSCGKLSHQDLIGYETIRMLRLQVKKNEDDEYDVPIQKILRVQSLDRHRQYPISYTDESGVFGNYLLDGLSLTSLSSVKKFSVKDAPKKQGQCYMGIALPIRLSDLFREVDRPKVPDINLLQESEAETDSEMSSSTDTTHDRLTRRVVEHDKKMCLSCSNNRRSYLSNRRERLLDEEEDDEATCNNVSLIKNNILNQIELIANPVALRQAKQTLLDLKQRYPEIFQDLCLYSEVCKILADNVYRLVARRFLQDVFYDVNFDAFAKDLHIIFSNDRNIASPATTPTTQNPPEVLVKKKIKYTDYAREQRKQELSQSSKPKTITIGFTVESDDKERFSPTRFEPRSPPLSSVKEENVASTENLLNESTKQNSITHKTENRPPSNTITLDQLKLTYNENKFPIKPRDEKNV